MEVIIGTTYNGQKRLVFEFTERGSEAKIVVFTENKEGKRERLTSVSVKDILNLARIFQNK